MPAGASNLATVTVQVSKDAPAETRWLINQATLTGAGLEPETIVIVAAVEDEPTYLPFIGKE